MMFQHGVDGYVIVDDVQMPLAEFVGYEPAYAGLPVGIVSRVYEPGVRHALSDGENVTGGPLPWAEGDLYLSKVVIYRTRHAML